MKEVISTRDFWDQQLGAAFSLLRLNTVQLHEHEARTLLPVKGHPHSQAGTFSEACPPHCPLHFHLCQGKQSVEYPQHQTRQALVPTLYCQHSA